MKPTDLTKTIAMFQSPYGTTTVWEVSADNPDSSLLDDWFRISQCLAVTLQPLPKDAVVAGQLQALAVAREKTVDEFKAKLDNIDGRMANLRALTDGRDK